MYRIVGDYILHIILRKLSPICCALIWIIIHGDLAKDIALMNINFIISMFVSQCLNPMEKYRIFKLKF